MSTSSGSGACDGASEGGGGAMDEGYDMVKESSNTGS